MSLKTTIFGGLSAVGLIAFASGIVAGLPTIYLMFSNGTMLGAMAALMTQFHKHGSTQKGPWQLFRIASPHGRLA